jgi:hypothetical protein
MAVVAACGSGSGSESLPLGSRPEGASTTTQGQATAPPGATRAEADIEVQLDPSTPGAPISTLLTGFSSTLDVADMQDAGITLTSFGGNPSTRYNYDIGHAWNHGADYEFRNTNYGATGDAAREFLRASDAAGAETRLAVPTLGWVARNDDEDTCSFPDGSGGCLPGSEVGTCEGDGPVADPTVANVESTPDGVVAWVKGLVDDGLAPEIIAMDNEPELWGVNHYDVHPRCPTYEEILDKYLTYASAIREVAPDALLAGPVACCWYDYWHTAPGPQDGAFEEYLDWFLRNVKAHDDETGQRTLDLLDVHYYPQSPVYNDTTDEDTNALRLRSTRSLWDPSYGDESWINTPIEFIPRMKRIIEQTYPGTPLLISEWNFGADGTMNGALAIAETLAIYGREGVAAAAYWRNPAVGSPGFLAFKMHGNYDSKGSRFGGDVVPTSSSDSGRVAAYGAVDEAAGLLRVMLINKDPDDALTVSLGGIGAATTARSYTLDAAAPDAIVPADVDPTAPVPVAPSSITVIEVDLA